MTEHTPHSELLSDAREALDYIADRLPPMGMTSIPEEPTKPAEANALHDAKRRIYRDLSGLEEQLETYERALDRIAEGATDNDHAQHCADWRHIAKVALRKRSNPASRREE